MKKGIIIHKSRKIAITLVIMLAIIGLSGTVSYHISKVEERACWNVLHQSVRQTVDEMKTQINSDQELLESIADIILQHDAIDSQEVQDIINGFHPNTMISHIALLLPGDKVMLPNEPIRDTGGVISFEKEAALGRHISDRSVDIRDKDRLILRNFVPIIKDGETIAMLYGVVDLNVLPEQLENTAYNGKAAIYIMDGSNGDFIVDTWHKSLGNITEIGERKAKKGYRQNQIQEDLFEGKSGYCVFVSQTVGEYLYFYYEPTSVNKWMVGISVAESLAFERVKKINMLLFAFIAIEIILLAGYFIWILQDTKKELYEKQKLAEMDVLTGLLNRNSYEKNIEEYPAQCKSNLICIYADANGLHELNNTEGHAAGDRMLQTVAHIMQSCFGVSDTYRIGGDEFVAFVKDELMENVENKITEVKKELTERGYHVSIGICRQEDEIDMIDMTKQAEKHMYEEKNRYYEEMGIDRRQRV